MISRILFFLIGFTMSGGLVVAQTGTVKGKITGSNGQPLAAATVVLPKLSKGGVTDSTRQFRLERIPFGTWQLEVSHLGFRPYKTSITVNSEKVTQDVVLTPATENSLNEVVVSGTMKEMSK